MFLSARTCWRVAGHGWKVLLRRLSPFVEEVLLLREPGREIARNVKRVDGLGHDVDMSQALESLVSTMTVAELAARAGITVATFVERAFGSSRNSARSSTKPAPAKPAAPKQPGTKPAATKSGKVARGGLSAEHILAALRAAGASAKLEAVRARTGGSVQQVRAALQKLAASKKVKITGQRRGTRYTAG
jgi:hypothetical protein